MHEPAEVEYLRPYIQSTIDAAARFRRVLIVMVTASILAFGAFWNSLDWTWFNARIAAARRAEAYVSLEEINRQLLKKERELDNIVERERQNVEKERQSGGKKNKQEREDQRRREDQQRLEDQRLENQRNGLIEDRDELLGMGTAILKDSLGGHIDLANRRQLQQELESKAHEPDRDWLSRRMMHDKAQVTQYAQKLEEMRTGNILLIHIPLAGGVFDVNTLGLWAGLTFAIILLVFRFSLWREYNNLKLTFNTAKPEHLEFCYLSLAMQQVLTVPPVLAKRKSADREKVDQGDAKTFQSRIPSKPWGRATQLLYFPPVVIQLLIILNDIKTEPIGDIFSPNLAATSIWLSSALLGFMVFLTANCLRLSRAIDHEWKRANVRLQPAEPNV